MLACFFNNFHFSGHWRPRGSEDPETGSGHQNILQIFLRLLVKARGQHLLVVKEKEDENRSENQEDSDDANDVCGANVLCVLGEHSDCFTEILNALNKEKIRTIIDW